MELYFISTIFMIDEMNLLTHKNVINDREIKLNITVISNYLKFNNKTLNTE